MLDKEAKLRVRSNARVCKQKSFEMAFLHILMSTHTKREIYKSALVLLGK